MLCGAMPFAVYLVWNYQRVGQTVEIRVEIIRARKIVECNYTCTNVGNKKIVRHGIE